MSAREPHYDVASKRIDDGPFADNLAAALAARKLTAADIAKRFGWCQRHCRRLITGEVKPHYMEIPMLARWLNVKPEVLAWSTP